MLTVGLTGGLACGKSTVATRLQQKGCGLVNADDLGHQAIAPDGPAYDAVVAEFGRDILDEHGRIERPKLAECVFGDPERVRRLNELVHPHIQQRIEQAMSEFARRQPRGILVLEAALLLEAFADARVDKVIVVDCTEAQQIARFQRKGGTAEEARRRMAAQMPRAERLRRADYVVDASGALKDTLRQVDSLYEVLNLQSSVLRPALPED